mmetsp:Transcript_1229/g.1636  ORF Transcript_1229/g.1636 Transcript_1229/m.1636 type:complete len:189 (+) Transcript_1229:514-1080(+)
MYGWKKWTSGKYKGAFHHPHFHQHKGSANDLMHIVRKAPPAEKVKKRPRKQQQSVPKHDENEVFEGRGFKRRMIAASSIGEKTQTHFDNPTPIQQHETTKPPWSNESRVSTIHSTTRMNASQCIDSPAADVGGNDTRRRDQNSHSLNLTQKNINSTTQRNIEGGRIHLLAAAAAFLYDLENRSNFPLG